MKNILKTLAVCCLLFFVMQPPAVWSQFFFVENEKIGKNAPDFTLNTLSGDNINLKKFRDGKKTIVFFWATWCPHCRESLSEMGKEKDQFEQKGIKLALVDIGEKAAIVKKYADEHKINWMIFLDEETKIAEDYGVVGVPTFFFINEDGLVKDVQHSLPYNFEKLF